MEFKELIWGAARCGPLKEVTLPNAGHSEAFCLFFPWDPGTPGLIQPGTHLIPAIQSVPNGHCYRDRPCPHVRATRGHRRLLRSHGIRRWVVLFGVVSVVAYLKAYVIVLSGTHTHTPPHRHINMSEKQEKRLSKKTKERHLRKRKMWWIWLFSNKIASFLYSLSEC